MPRQPTLRDVAARPAANESREQVFAALAGLVFGMVLLKLGNPVIFATTEYSPGNLLNILLMSWPVRWGYGLLAILVLSGLLLLVKPAARRSQAPWRRLDWLLFLLPLIWFGWQCLAASQSVEPHLTRLVLPHFAACVVCFLAGRLMLPRIGDLRWFWAGLMTAFLFTLLAGWQQHFGGLEETRRQFEALPPDERVRMDSPELRARMNSNRIFSTFVYPNAFAGAILLLLPACAYAGWRWGSRHRQEIGSVLAAMPILMGTACLYWSGSKAGWLIALLVILAAVWFSNWPCALRSAVVGTALALGLAGFFIKHSDYFAKGAGSAGARLEYWRAAATVAKQRPLFGSGPGTFSVMYKRIKPPEAEMAKLAHNDYLQQASDSGIPGFLAYAAFVAGTLILAIRRSQRSGWRWMAWLGGGGFALQGLVEFGLYIPALAWTAFLLLGWLQSPPPQPHDEGTSAPAQRLA